MPKSASSAAQPRAEELSGSRNSIQTCNPASMFNPAELCSVVEIGTADSAPNIVAHSPSTAAYRGGAIHRNNIKWMPGNRSGDSAINEAWSLLLSRLRDLGRNDVWARASRNKLTRRVIGTGIEPKAAVEGYDEFNTEADDRFAHWAECEADAEGERTLWKMQRQAFGEVEEVGEILLLECHNPDPARSTSLCYQLLDSEYIDDGKHQPWPDSKGHRIIRGIEFDQHNRKVAYWLFETHPFGLEPYGAATSRRIPASRVLHIYNAERVSQRRGVSPYAVNMQNSRDLDWLIGCELRKAHNQSLFTVAHKRAFTSPGTGFDDGSGNDSDRNGNPLDQLGSGIICHIAPDEAIEMIESKIGGGQNFDKFVKLILMQNAAGRGLSYTGLTGDVSQATFSSMRAAGNDDADLIEILQDDFASNPVLPIYRAFMQHAAAAGRFSTVPAATFLKNPRRFSRCTLHFPGRKQIDVATETQSALLRIFGGLGTWKDELAKLGYDYREVFAQLKSEWDLLAEHGMKADLNRLAMALGTTIATGGKTLDESEGSDAE